MDTIWIEEPRLRRILARNEAFWRGELEERPLMWVTVPAARPGAPPPEPEREEALWTDVDYVMAAAEDSLARTHYAGDALPVFNPWLGPDQFAAWLGAELTLRPRDNTSWVKPFVEDWSEHPVLAIREDNPWWTLYLSILHRSVEAGRERWVTTYPDLHSGMDALSAVRGPERLLVDLMENPEPVLRAMEQMTGLFRQVIDRVDAVVLPAGQGTSNWTMGWSAGRFCCIGQNDFTCMIGPEMFARFCYRDTLETTAYMDRSIYHLDGPGAVRHLEQILAIEQLDCLQWIQGAGAPHPTRWLPLLKQAQGAGKSVQLYYGPVHGAGADLEEELSILCCELDPRRLFFWAEVDSAELADALVEAGRRFSRGRM